MNFAIFIRMTVWTIRKAVLKGWTSICLLLWFLEDNEKFIMDSNFDWVLIVSFQELLRIICEISSFPLTAEISSASTTGLSESHSSVQNFPHQHHETRLHNTSPAYSNIPEGVFGARGTAFGLFPLVSQPQREKEWIFISIIQYIAEK